jgi:3-methyladenine DNA glycosylase AlkD
MKKIIIQTNMSINKINQNDLSIQSNQKKLLTQLLNELNCASNSKKATILKSFFKTKKGEYAHGDIFLGISVPQQRTIAKKYYSLNLLSLKKLLESKYHEYRFIALIILLEKYSLAIKKQDVVAQKTICEFYITNSYHINNWDLVDVSASKILGHYTYTYPSQQKILTNLFKKNTLWSMRIAIVSTHYHIKQNDYKPLFFFITNYLKKSTYKHDLLDKAIGWMLRELGKQDKKNLNNFLISYANKLPRTSLRYALEKHSSLEKKYFMNL